MYNILDINGAEDTNDNTTVTVPGVERVTTLGSDNAGGTYVATNASSITAEVTTAINHLAANQTRILQQMAAMSVAPPPPAVAALVFNIPPVTSVAIPTGGFQQGDSLARGGGHGRGRGGCRIRAGRGRNLFAMHMATIGHGGAGQCISPFGRQTVSTGVAIPPSCSHNSSIVTGLLPTRSSDTTIETCATPVDLTLRMMMDIHW